MDTEKNSYGWYLLRKGKEAHEAVGSLRCRVPPCASTIVFMLIKDIDIHKIEKLLQSVPDNLECESIYFVGNSYQLKLIAGSDEVRSVDKAKALNELQAILKNFV